MTLPPDTGLLLSTLSKEANIPLSSDQNREPTPENFDSSIYFPVDLDSLDYNSLHLLERASEQIVTTTYPTNQNGTAKRPSDTYGPATMTESYTTFDAVYNPTGPYLTSFIGSSHRAAAENPTHYVGSLRPIASNGPYIPLNHPASGMGEVPFYNHGEGMQTSTQRVATKRTRLVCKWEGCTYLKSFSRERNLLRHIETLHISPQSFPCDVCGKSFNRLDVLKNHVLQKHAAARLT